jgi:PhnB protein
MFVEAIPVRYRCSVVPHVMIDGAANAIEFYEKAFGATEIFRVATPNGKVIHAEIRIEESVLMLGDAESPFRHPKATRGTTVGLHLYVKDVDTLFARAIGAGAREIQPVRDMFYGDRTAMLEDPFGHIWVLLTHLEDLSPEEIVERAEHALNQ